MAGILFYARTRVQVRTALRAKGKSLLGSITLANSLDADTIDGCVTEAGIEMQVEAIGDGGFLDRIIEFFKGPAGQALISLLLKLLLGGLMLSTNVETSSLRVSSETSAGVLVGQKGILDYVRLLRSLREAISARNLAAIAQLLRDLGLAVGFAAEAGPLADALLAVAQGEWAVVADSVGRFLVLVAAHFMNGFSVMAEGQDVVGEVLYTIKLLK